MSFKYCSVIATLVVFLGCAKPVRAPDAVPVASAGVVATGTIVSLDGSGSTDPNEPPRPLVYRWAFRTLPPGSKARLNDASIVNPSFLADVDGEYDVELVVSNGLLHSLPAVTTVTAGPCGASAPAVSAVAAAPAAPSTGQTVQLTATFSDADTGPSCALSQSHTLKWSMAALPAGSDARLNNEAAVNPSFLADKPGDYELRLVVTDSTGRASAPFSFTVTAAGCGAASPSVEKPVATPASPNVGQQVALTAAVVDADNEPSCDAKQTFTHQWAFVSLPPGSAATLNSATIENPSFTPDLAGSYVVRVRVTDSTGKATLSESTIITVSTCGGARPIVTGITPAPAAPNSGNVIQLAAAVSDADALAPCSEPQSYSYQWQFAALPAGSRAALNNAQASNPSFTADAPGDYVVRLTVTDQQGNVGPMKEATVAVSTCGSAVPVATVQAPPTGLPGEPVQLSAAVTDADSACAQLPAEQFTYAWWFDELPQGSQARLNDAAVKAPSFVPDVPGQYRLKVVVTDLAGHASAPATATVTISPCGANAPTVTLASVPAANIGQLIALQATASDADNDPACRTSADGGVVSAPLQTFRYAWAFESVPAGSQATLNNSQVSSPSFVGDVAGQYQLRVRVTDSTGRSVLSDALVVVVNPCGGSAPAVTSVAQSPTGSIPVGLGVALRPQVDDSDVTGCGQAPAFTYAWRFEELPAGSQASLAGATGRVPSFVPDVAGAYVLTVVVTDSTGLRSAPFAVTVNASACGTNPPSATVAVTPASAMLGAPVQMTANPSDADNSSACRPPLSGALQTFSYQWSFDEVPAGSTAAIGAATARAATFQPDVAGQYRLKLVVTDSTGRSSETLQAFVVSACGGNTPIVTGFSPASPISAALNQPLRVTGLFEDADNLADDGNASNGVECQAAQFLNGQLQTFTYQWRFKELPLGSQVQLNDATSLRPSFSPDVRGTYVLEFVVQDSTGRRSSPRELTVTGASCGDNDPSASPVNPPLANIGAAVQLNANASDPDNTAPTCNLGQTLRCSWWFDQLPAGSLAAFNDAGACNPSFVADQPSSVASPYRATVLVTDSTGRQSAARTVEVRTNGTCAGNAPVAAATCTNCNTADCRVLGFGSVTVQVDAEASGNSSCDPDNLASFPHCPASACATPLSPQQTVEYRWQLFSVPAGSTATLSPGPAARNPWFSANVAGDYVLRLMATDSTGRSSPVAVKTISVKPSCP